MTCIRRNSYTVEFKIAVVEWQRKNQASLHKTAAEFSIDRKRVREWHDQYSVLKANECGAKKKRRRLYSGGRRPLSTDLDQKVFQFLEEERSEGRVVTNDMLRTKAVQIAGGLSIQGFKGSNGWLWRWKKRYEVGMRAGTNSAQNDDLPSVDSEPEDQESESDGDEGDACAAADDVDDIDHFSDDSDSDSD